MYSGVVSPSTAQSLILYSVRRVTRHLGAAGRVNRSETWSKSINRHAQIRIQKLGAADTP